MFMYIVPETYNTVHLYTFGTNLIPVGAKKSPQQTEGFK
jgi:hypothetical protein